MKHRPLPSFAFTAFVRLGLIALLALGSGLFAANSQLLVKKPDGSWNFPTLTVGGKSWNAGTFDFSYAGYHYGEREDLTGIPAATQTISAAANEDITDKLNAALAALPSGGTVIIPAGTFRIGTGGKSVNVTTDNTVIKGAGIGRTTLQVDATYHAAEAAADRQNAAFGTGVVNFQKAESSSWHYARATGGTTVKSPVTLGTRTLTVASAAALNVGDQIVIRQIMSEKFVRQNAFNPAKAPRALRWTNYDSDNQPKFTDASHAFAFLRCIVAKKGDALLLDVPIPRDLDPAEMAVTVSPLSVELLRNCGLQDLTFTAAPEEGVTTPESDIGTTVAIKGLHNGLFKNVEIASFRTQAFMTSHSVNVTFLNCIAANAHNSGGGGSGYGFYIKGQNLLYKNCTASQTRHGFTTAAPQTSNIVIKGCKSLDSRFNTDITTGECVDDTHLKYAYAILWDNHYSKESGLLMVNRGTLSGDAYETCGWAIVWNYESAGLNTRSSTNNDLRRNLVGVTPAEFGIVVGAHATTGPDGIRVQDGYARFPATTQGTRITTPDLQVGPVSKRVLFELTGQPVTGSIYDIQLAQRARLLP
ncbi:hypothetical protein [Rariglobus hedericola]|uniref:Pectate lyase superfamily protein domain-containing protein n=1 Tax=Rariglobus hedericola TaxID=2597822 RepID=A0A556QRR4_9BACT|nr:hypothetical protein [Rariglobus hedericola]TSJ79337.1 hypothetical protein FPL22_08620 [Rariglobus hedericola]